MPSRKRSFEADAVDIASEHGLLLDRIRNMWQFANLCQWIYIFGKAAKIDESLDIEEIEIECLKSDSTILNNIALSLLKLISSHRGLTHDIFDDQARKHYINRAPDDNPFGDEEDARSFIDFDIFTKIRVLQQFTQWIMSYPERLRDKMEEQRDSDQTNWRIEPYGWDSKDRAYYVLDDNRVYRLTEAPISLPTTKPPRPKKKAKTFRSGERRSSRRHEVVETEHPSLEPEDDSMVAETTKALMAQSGLGGMGWECIAITLEDVRRLLEAIEKSRDQNEKVLHRQLEDHLIPILEKQEESRRRKEVQREKELFNLARLANAKRSSRIAGKRERQEEEAKAVEEDRLRKEEANSKQRKELEELKVEKERELRLQSRKRRLEEREERRRLYQEELAQLSENSKVREGEAGRISERNLQAEIERNKQALEEIDNEDEDWIFDCICGLYGQVDDGAHSIACEKCNIWQHSRCLGVSETEAERPDFRFLCASCKKSEETPTRVKPVIKIKLNRPGSSGSQGTEDEIEQFHKTRQMSSIVVELPKKPNPESVSAEILGGSTPNSRSMPEAQQPSQSVTTTESDAQPAQVISTAPAQELSRDISQPKSSPIIVASTPASVRRLHDGEQANLSLHSPHISQEINHSAQNGAVPSHAGYSPTKHSPEPHQSPSPGKIRPGMSVFPPTMNLSPTPQVTILTPPVKPADPPRPYSSFGSVKSQPDSSTA